MLKRLLTLHKFKKMKKTLLSLFLLTGFLTSAQEVVDETVSTEEKNMIKLNVMALSTGTISVQYERLITPKTTVGASVNLMPKRGIPFFGSIESLINDAVTSNQIKSAKINSFSITPEARFYLGKEGFKGFYVAPFVRYASHGAEFPLAYDYNGEKEHITLDGKLNTFSAGFAIGAQWKIAKQIYLDWLIMGPMYGSAKGDLSGKRALNADEVKEIDKALKDLDLPIIDTTYEVNEQGAKAKVKGPWAGIRAAIGVGYRF